MSATKPMRLVFGQTLLELAEDYPEDHPFRIGRGIVLREGGDVTVIAVEDAIEAKEAIREPVDLK